MKKHKNSRAAGFTLVEIMIVVAIIGLLAAIAIPNFLKARETSEMNVCISNLHELDAAKQQWALETGKTSTVTPETTDIQPYLGRGTAGDLNTMYCPLDPKKSITSSYQILEVGQIPLCILAGATESGDGGNTNYEHVLK